MADRRRERLLATCADRGEAMVIESVLEANGVICRVGDLAGVPAHMFGIAGAAGRSVGVWVLETEVERATLLLATLGTPGSGMDEEALAAEAVSAAAPLAGAPETEQVVEPVRASPSAAAAAPSRWSGLAILVPILVLAAVLAWRGCRG